jgi:hypothetical protein
MAVAGGVEVSNEQLQDLRDFVADIVGDLNNDGEARIDLTYIDLNSADMNGYSRLELAVADEDYTLFLLDELRADQIGSRGDLDNLNRFGFEPEAQNAPWRVFIGDNPIIADLPKPADSGSLNQRFSNVAFACISDWTSLGKGDEARTDAAIRVVEQLITNKAVPSTQEINN